MTDPSGLDAIISSSSSPYSTCDTEFGTRGQTSDTGHTDHAPGQAAVQDIPQGVNGGLVDGQREEGLEGTGVGGGDQEAVEDPDGEHDAGGVSAARVPVPSVALTLDTEIIQLQQFNVQMIPMSVAFALKKMKHKNMFTNVQKYWNRQK